MKLLKKINRDYLLSSALVLLFGLMASYFLINQLVFSEIEESLNASASRIEKQLKQQKKIPNLYPLIEVNVVKNLQHIVLKDTSIYDPIEGESEMFKELNTYRNINGQIYHITVRTLTVEKTDIVMSIFLGITGIFLLLIVALYFINKKTASSIWKPFNENLERLRTFSLKDRKKIVLQETGITEFDELNSRIAELSEKVVSDYISLKEFTENASHEIQTPLAVIQAKTENLVNSQSLTKDQLEVLYSILENINRLSKMSSTLLLLTKIESAQFSEPEDIDFAPLIRDNIDAMKELFDLRHIKTNIAQPGIFKVKMDRTLATILINNLLKNILMHTPEKGEVIIKIRQESLVFANSGKQALKDKERIFDRFYKESTAESSTGLGLALVKKICEVSNLKIDYSYEKNMHLFMLRN